MRQNKGHCKHLPSFFGEFVTDETVYIE